MLAVGAAEIIVALGAIAGLIAYLLHRWTGEPARKKRWQKAKDKAHAANAKKDGKALSEHFRRRRKP